MVAVHMCIASALVKGRSAAAIARADRATYRSCSSRCEKVRARVTSLRSSLADRLRAPTSALCRRRLVLLSGRRARALERNSTGLLIDLELLVQRGATGTAVGVRE